MRRTCIWSVAKAAASRSVTIKSLNQVISATTAKIDIAMMPKILEGTSPL